jgi:hypothetical protein
VSGTFTNVCSNDVVGGNIRSVDIQHSPLRRSGLTCKRTSYHAGPSLTDVFQVDSIGQIMSLTAIFYIVIAPFALPWIKDRLGTIRGLTLIFMAWPTISLLIPVTTYLAGRNRILMGIVLTFQLAAKVN